MGPMAFCWCQISYVYLSLPWFFKKVFVLAFVPFLDGFYSNFYPERVSSNSLSTVMIQLPITVFGTICKFVFSISYVFDQILVCHRLWKPLRQRFCLRFHRPPFSLFPWFLSGLLLLVCTNSFLHLHPPLPDHLSGRLLWGTCWWLSRQVSARDTRHSSHFTKSLLTALILDISFSVHEIVSLPYIKTSTSKNL